MSEHVCVCVCLLSASLWAFLRHLRVLCAYLHTCVLHVRMPSVRSCHHRLVVDQVAFLVGL